MKSLASSAVQLAALAALICLAACGVPITSLTLPDQATLDVNGTLQLTAVIAPSNASGDQLVWWSSDSSIAKVSSTGLVAGLAPGAVTIEVSTPDGKINSSCQVAVIIPATGVTSNPSAANLLIGITLQLTATLAPGNTTDSYELWSSSNNAIATVTTTGLVTGVAVGVATIIASTIDGVHSATSTITVSSVGSIIASDDGPQGGPANLAVAEGDSISYSGAACDGSGQASTILIILSDTAGVCSGYQAAAATANALLLTLSVTGTPASSGGAAPAIGAGTYLIGTPEVSLSGDVFTAQAVQSLNPEEGCVAASTTATSGSITIDSIDAGVFIGTYQASFGTSTQLSGTFNAPVCNLSAADFCTATDGSLACH